MLKGGFAMTILDVIREDLYPSAVIVPDEANSDNSIKFLRNGSIADEIWVAIRNGRYIDIYDHEGRWMTGRTIKG